MPCTRPFPSVRMTNVRPEVWIPASGPCSDCCPTPRITESLTLVADPGAGTSRGAWAYHRGGGELRSWNGGAGIRPEAGALTLSVPLSSCSCGKSWSGGDPGSCMSTRRTWCGRCATKSRSISRKRSPACCWSPSGINTRMWPR